MNKHTARWRPKRLTDQRSEQVPGPGPHSKTNCTRSARLVRLVCVVRIGPRTGPWSAAGRDTTL
jgi:hypothetical protein